MTFAEVVGSVGPGSVPEVWVSVVDTGVIDDWAGGSWRLSGRVLDVRVARRLAVGADLVVLGREGSTRLEDVPAGRRAAVWEAAGRRYAGPGGKAEGPEWPRRPLYRAFRFVSEDGRTLLLIDESC
ncbi:hypothetical protein [Streptomyces sp. WELS2]|uniref:hypothetical protein n=1 Tax=Streptomyces sp. WELS2 TaxID=2749435 RepID=UPI0015F104A9|nr:hypothetical protein [Streptomyces sp. WELS2]